MLMLLNVDLDKAEAGSILDLSYCQQIAGKTTMYLINFLSLMNFFKVLKSLDNIGALWQRGMWYARFGL